MASQAEIRAVRKVLYDPKRNREASDHLSSIRTIMDLDGHGPTWYIPATGELTAGMQEVADRCEKLAALNDKTRHELADVRFDRSDKRKLLDALDHQAKGWRKRAQVYRHADGPDVDRVAAAIAQHEKASFEALKATREYLR